MALPEGRICFTRPDRSTPRKYTASDVGRIVRYAREAGESEEDICAAIVLKGGLQCGDCDCERLKQLIELTLGVIALVVAVRARNRRAMKEALEVIRKAQESSRQAMGRIELEKVQSYITSMEKSDAQLDESLDSLQELLLESQSTAFGKEPEVVITPD